MAKFQLTFDQILLLMVNAASSLKENPTCYCETSDLCFNCETINVMKSVKKKTGMSISLPELKKYEPRVRTTMTSSDGTVSVEEPV